VSGDVELSLRSLHVYPVKSCAGVTLDESTIVETGLEFDRTWMLVDEHAAFVSQRELPRMALVQPTLRTFDVVLRAPGMLALHFALDTVHEPARVTLRDDVLQAFDMGDLAAQWFSDFLGRRLRLVRFDPAQRRLSNARWTGPIEAENAFSDGYPILAASSASLDELNARLQLSGGAPVTMQRFRPNLVLDGLAAHDEDHLDEITFDTESGAVRLKLVKPCSRCSIPDVDPATGTTGHAVGDALAAYRSDPRLGGAITFAMNAVVVEGFGLALRSGLAGRGSYRFA
jgi:uncharacterized protein